ncbi:MAG: hypothetical protein EOP54_11850 [Sphingobacteriales bacterium]|nr:MAG: hypothetical protein EOP54_11850 [Sphingobacteriales bacterium]
MKKILTLALIALVVNASTYAQEVVQNSLEWKNIRIRSGLSIYIPYVKLEETQLTGELYVEGAYALGKKADATASLHIGSFKGVSVGGTYHMKDKLTSKKSKFTVSSTTRGNKETHTFYKQMTEYRVAAGPTAKLKVGIFGNSGFYTRIEGGWDWQTYSRAYYNNYASNRNGFTSVKLLATIANFRQFEINSSYEEQYVGRVGVGGLVSLFHERKPWKKVSYHIGLDMGYMHVLGAKNASNSFVTLEVNKANYILELKGGISVSL